MNGQTLDEVAQRYELTRERVRQIQVKATEFVRAKVTEQREFGHLAVR